MGWLLLFDEIELDAQFFQLIGADSRRSFGHGALRALGLGECDDIPDRIGAAQKHDQPIEAEGDSTMWRSAIFQGFQQETELRLRLILSDAEEIQNTELDVAAVIRMLPPPISLPLSTISYAFALASTAPYRGTEDLHPSAPQRIVHEDVALFFRRIVQEGNSVTQSGFQAVLSIKFNSSPSSRRIRPSTSCTMARFIRAEKHQSPGFASGKAAQRPGHRET